MKAWHVAFGGGLDSLRVVDVPRPVPGPGQVLVEIEAVSLNRRELSVLEGQYPLPVKDTLIPVSDGVGRVVEVGEGTQGVVVGDRVLGAVFPEWIEGPFSIDRAAQLGGSRDGMLAEYVCLDATAAVRVPEEIAVEQAACLPCAGVTAWHALHAGTPLQSGDTVLTTTSGGVSLYSALLAKALGCRVIVATGNTARTATLSDLGVDGVLPRANMIGGVLGLTESRGSDKTLHMHGDIDQSLASTKVAGSISLVSPAGASTIDPFLAFGRNVAIHAISLGGVHHTRELVDFVATHDVRIPIAATYPFGDARAAYAEYIDHRPFGKILIRAR